MSLSRFGLTRVTWAGEFLVATASKFRASGGRLRRGSLSFSGRWSVPMIAAPILWCWLCAVCGGDRRPMPDKPFASTSR